MTKTRQSKIPKARYPWLWECESWTMVICEMICVVFMALLLMTTDIAILQLEILVVLLPVTIHLIMNAVTFTGLYIILRIKTTPDEFLVYCNLASNYGKREMIAAGVDADFINQADKKLSDIINRHFFFCIADRRVYQYM